MSSMQTWRKAYGALKYQTTVDLGHVNSDFKDVDAVIGKATNHIECPPKEKHIRKILAYTSVNRPRADVQYCILALARRLAKARNWTVALKTLVVIHRTLREGDPTSREELINFQQRTRVLQLANIKDDSSPIAWDCSAWVQTYGLFLEERIWCFRVLKYDIEAEGIPKPAQGQDNKGYGRTRDFESEELMDQLPYLQQLLYRLLGCRAVLYLIIYYDKFNFNHILVNQIYIFSVFLQPEGAAVGNYLIQYALALVLKESFKIYCAVNDGIINLIDKFFMMLRQDAFKALDIYRRACQQAGSLSDFYEVCKGLELARNFQFPVLREPPQSFLATMEEYVREANMPPQSFLATMEEYIREARMVVGPTQPFESPERLMLTYKPEEHTSPQEEDKNSPAESKPLPTDDFIASNDVPEATQLPTPPTFNSMDPDDLLGLNFDALGAAIENSIALALAIVPNDTTSSGSTFQAKDFDPFGWELALVSTPSTNISSVQDRQLVGGLDSQQNSHDNPQQNPFIDSGFGGQ